MEINAIFACGSNGAFGNNNDLPWFEPNDLKHFKQITKGYAVIMGRKTWESLPPNRRPLPGRDNLVVSTTQRGEFFVGSLHEALVIAKAKGNRKAFIIGGADLIKAAIPHVDFIYRTVIPYYGPFTKEAPVFSALDWVCYDRDYVTNNEGDDKLTLELWGPRMTSGKKLRTLFRRAQYKLLTLQNKSE